MNFLSSYLLTLLVEIVVLLLLLKKEDKRLVVLAGILASSLTLPIIWFWAMPLYEYLASLLLGLPYLIYILAFELFAVVAEAAIYKKIFEKLDWSRALFVSLAANAASFLAGLALQ